MLLAPDIYDKRIFFRLAFCGGSQTAGALCSINAQLRLKIRAGVDIFG
jgi:hypothetical protein